MFRVFLDKITVSKNVIGDCSFDRPVSAGLISLINVHLKIIPSLAEGFG